MDKAFWQNLLTGLLFQSAYLTRLNEKEAISFLQFVESILLLAYPRIKNVDANFFGSYVWLLSHPIWAVRRATAEVTARLHPQLPKLTDLLATATVRFVNELSASVTAAASAPANANANPNPVVVPTPQVLSATISRSVSPSLSEALIPTLFATAHLPYVDSHAWSNTAKSLAKLSGDLFQKEYMAKTLVDYLMSAEVLLSKVRILIYTTVFVHLHLVQDTNFQQAGAQALATAAQASGDTIVPQAIAQLQELLSSQKLSAITATDVAVFNTPEGELYEKGIELSL